MSTNNATAVQLDILVIGGEPVKVTVHIYIYNSIWLTLMKFFLTFSGQFFTLRVNYA